tara:strand:- start:651 stop:932 length:282 start_codon:yes stop_codon:yes gene_type:complete
MKITFAYPQQDNNTLLVDDKDRMFLVAFNVITNTTEGLGFIDYYTPLDEDETTIEIEIVDCFITNDSFENMDKATLCEELIINEYLTNIYNEG